jgi:hypothetical protein
MRRRYVSPLPNIAFTTIEASSIFIVHTTGTNNCNTPF